MPRLLSLSLRLRKDPVKLVIKAKGLIGPKTKVRARRLSPPQRPRLLLRPRQRRQRPRPKRLILRPRMLLRPKQRRQRPRPKRLILRPRMFLPPSRAKTKTPQGQEVALRTYLVVSFVVSLLLLLLLLFFYLFIFFCSGILSMYIMYSLFCLMKMFFFLSLVPLLYVL